MKRKPKHKPLRPSDNPQVGQSVLAPIDGFNLPLSAATIKRVDPPTEDTFRPGLFLQSVMVEDYRGFGNWFTLWDRPEAVGDIFLPSK